MATETHTRRGVGAEDYVQFVILGLVVSAALAGAFTHMHDWTIDAIDGALSAIGSDKRTPDWIGWANAVISELLPTSSILSYRKRQRQGRSTTVPIIIFIGSAGVSLLAQLSATGVEVPGAAQFLACLPALAVMILGKVILADVEHAAKQAERAEERARRKATTVARRQAFAAKQAQRAAELAAEQARQRAELAAELAAEQARRDAEHAAELERQRLAAIAAAEAERVRIEQAALTERERIAADERRAEREARQRIEAERIEAERRRLDEAARIRAEGEAEAARIAAAAEARRVEAEAARLEAETQARRAAAERIAAARHEARGGAVGGSDDEATRERRRRPAAETAALVDDVLAALPDGTERPAAVLAVVAALNVTPEYARRFVPAGWVAGSSAAAGGDSSVRPRHLTAVGSA